MYINSKSSLILQSQILETDWEKRWLLLNIKIYSVKLNLQIMNKKILFFD